MKYLAHKFSNLVENIEPQDGLDALEEEINCHTTDDELKDISPDTFYEEFWLRVGQMTEGESNWLKYPILSRFALVLATGFKSNSEAERGFSVQTDLHRDPKRNLMSQDTFEANMQIHYGVEGKQTEELCSKCVKHKAADTTPAKHCHCCVAEISTQMKENCKAAWKEEKTKKQNAAKITPIEQLDVDKKSEKAQQEATNRSLLFARSLKTRTTFNVPSLMTKVFPTADELKARKREEAAKVKEKKTMEINERAKTHAETYRKRRLEKETRSETILKKKAVFHQRKLRSFYSRELYSFFKKNILLNHCFGNFVWVGPLVWVWVVWNN